MHRSCRSFVALCLLVVVVAVGTPATVLAQRSEDVAQAESNRQPMPTLVVYALKYVEAADCAEILSALLEQRGGAGGFSAAPQVRIAVEPRRNTLIVSGTEEQTNMVGDLLKLLDQPTDPVESTVEVDQLKNVRVEIFWLGSAAGEFMLVPMTDAQKQLSDLSKIQPQLDRFELVDLSLISRLSMQTVVGPNRPGELEGEGIGDNTAGMSLSVMGTFAMVGPEQYDVQLTARILGEEVQSSLEVSFLTKEGKTMCLAMADTGPVRSIFLVRLSRDDQ